MNPCVDWFFNKPSKWQDAYQALREIVLSLDLKEEQKWGCPCYTLEHKNVVLIHGFKEYCALLFMKGSIMNDPKNILIQQTVNVQSARQLRFKNLDEIVKSKSTIKSFLNNAIDIEKSGIKLELKKPKEYTIPEELQAAFNEWDELKSAFEKLSPGRQNGYLLHFSSAKQSKTRQQRIEKVIPNILIGKGMND